MTQLFDLSLSVCQANLREGGELVVGDGDVEGVRSGVEALKGDDGALVAVDLEEVRLLLLLLAVCRDDLVGEAVVGVLVGGQHVADHGTRKVILEVRLMIRFRSFSVSLKIVKIHSN